MPRKPNSRNDGSSTPDGQALTQRWHAVQVEVKCSMLMEPGGETGLVRRMGMVVGLLWMIFFAGYGPTQLPLAVVEAVFTALVVQAIAAKRPDLVPGVLFESEKHFARGEQHAS